MCTIYPHGAQARWGAGREGCFLPLASLLPRPRLPPSPPQEVKQLEGKEGISPTQSNVL